MNHQFALLLTLVLCVPVARAQDSSVSVPTPTLEELKATGTRHSSYRKHASAPSNVATEPAAQAPKANLAGFQKHIGPILKTTCVDCNGAETQEGNFRIDTLDPDLFGGEDVDWWLEILAVLTNGEMPPVDEAEMADADRTRVVEWLSNELHSASIARRNAGGHSSFRRMTGYEYSYALQDLLGLPFDFAKDLPPEAVSEDGFRNSSEILHMSAMQLATYRESALNALKQATVRGDQPQPIYWGVSMEAAAEKAFAKQQEELGQLEQEHKDDPEKLKLELETAATELLQR